VCICKGSAPEGGQISGFRVYWLRTAPVCLLQDGRYKATWKREFKLLWRKAGLLISMIKWTRTSKLSIKISLSLQDAAVEHAFSLNEEPACVFAKALRRREGGGGLSWVGV
jgi:hypothetical protein